MAEYISKHEAYKMLKDKQAAYMQVAVNEAFGTAARMIDKMKSADVQPVDRWISVKEKLPPEDESVLIYTIMGMCVAARWDDRFFVSKTASFVKYDVTHWMPLPEPPKDGDAE